MTKTLSTDGIHPPYPQLQAQDVGSAVVAPISFGIGVGECTVVTGQSGAGKTRLLRLLADLDPGTGEVFLNGRGRSAHTAPEWRKKVLYQGAEVTWWYQTVIEHLSAEEHGAAYILAERLNLDADRLKAPIYQLSTGERQRAALIRSLLKRPNVLMLDEPSSALDATNVRCMEELLLSQMLGGMSILLVTHLPEQAVRLATNTIEVKRR